MLAGEQCLSVLSPDQSILLCPPPKTSVIGTTSSSDKAAAANLSAYLNLSGHVDAAAHHTAAQQLGAGRRVYIQLTNFRCIVKFFGEEHTSALSLPYSAIQEVTAETVSGAKINVCSSLFSRAGGSGSSASSAWKFFSPQQQQPSQQVCLLNLVNPASPTTNVAIAVTPPTTPTSRRQAEKRGGGVGGTSVGRNRHHHAQHQQQQATNIDEDGNSTPTTPTPASNSAGATPRNLDVAGPISSTNNNNNNNNNNNTGGSAALSVPSPPETLNATAVFKPENSSSQTFSDHHHSTTNNDDKKNTTDDQVNNGDDASSNSSSRNNLESVQNLKSQSTAASEATFDVVKTSEVRREQLHLFQQQQQQQLEGIHYNHMCLVSGGGGGANAAASSANTAASSSSADQTQQQAQLLTKQPIASVQITSLHGWSWRLVDPSAVQQDASVMNQQYLGMQDQTEMRGLTKFVNELRQIMTLLAEAPELFATVSSAAVARSEAMKRSSSQQQQPSSPTARGGGGGGGGGGGHDDNAADNDALTATPFSPLHGGDTGAANSNAISNPSSFFIPSEDQTGWHIYSARRDLDRMLNAAANRDLQLRALARLSSNKTSNNATNNKSAAVPLPIPAAVSSHFNHHNISSASASASSYSGVSPHTASAFENSFAVVRIDHGSSRFATYPFEVIVPASVDIDQLLEASHCRQNGRVPVISWLCPHRRVTLSRSSQPLVTGQWNAEADVHLLHCIRRAFLFRRPDGTWAAAAAGTSQQQTNTTPAFGISPSSSQQQQSMGNSSGTTNQQPMLVVADCRSRQAATSNMALGGGYETQARYGKEIDTIFLDLPNIHDIIKEFEKLREASAVQSQRVSLTGAHPLHWAVHQHSAPEDDGWQKRRRKLIRASASIALLLDRGTSVLVHCTDGWDRTPQVCCIAKIILDSYYRTIRGFCELVEREWAQLGHRFADRNCGPVPSSAAASASTQGGGGGGGGGGATVQSPQQPHSTTTANNSSNVSAFQTHMMTAEQQQQQQTSGNNNNNNNNNIAPAETAAALPDWCRYPDVNEVKPQVSPIFLQFLDAVRELVEMFPARFEFTPALLSAMLHSAYSGEYGTFLCNTHRQRHHPVTGLAHRSLSFWTELAKAVDDELGLADASSSSSSSKTSEADEKNTSSFGGERGGNKQQQQQANSSPMSSSSSSSRLCECPGSDGLPIVNPMHHSSLRSVQLQQSELKDGGGFLTNVAVDDGSVLVPVFDMFGGGRALWSSWFTLAPKWNRFADITTCKHYQLTSSSTPAAVAGGAAAAAVVVRDNSSSSSSSTRSQQKAIAELPATLRTFPDALTNLLRHNRTILAPPEGSASSPLLLHQQQLQQANAAAAVASLPASSSLMTTTTTRRSPNLHASGGQQQQQQGSPYSSSSPPPLALQFQGNAVGVSDGGGGGGGGDDGGGVGAFNNMTMMDYLPLRERDDDENCYNCKKHFSLFQRRHTCRACCHSFCAECGNKFCVIFAGLVRDRETREAVIKKPETAVRLCDDCYYDLAAA